MTEFWLLLAPTEPTECSVLSENLYVVGPRLYTTAGLSDRTLARALHIIEYAAPAPLLQLFPYQSTKGETTRITDLDRDAAVSRVGSGTPA